MNFIFIEVWFKFWQRSHPCNKSKFLLWFEFFIFFYQKETYRFLISHISVDITIFIGHCFSYDAFFFFNFIPSILWNVPFLKVTLCSNLPQLPFTHIFFENDTKTLNRYRINFISNFLWGCMKKSSKLVNGWTVKEGRIHS